MKELLEKYGPFGASLVVVLFSGWFVIQNAGDWVVLQAQASEERADNARVLYEITLTRINDLELEKIRVKGRDIDEDTKNEYLNRIDKEIKRLTKRSECLEEVMETGEHRKC